MSDTSLGEVVIEYSNLIQKGQFVKFQKNTFVPLTDIRFCCKVVWDENNFKKRLTEIRFVSKGTEAASGRLRKTKNPSSRT